MTCLGKGARVVVGVPGCLENLSENEMCFPGSRMYLVLGMWLAFHLNLSVSAGFACLQTRSLEAQ